jgi:hypothetical protein
MAEKVFWIGVGLAVLIVVGGEVAAFRTALHHVDSVTPDMPPAAYAGERP